jgi:hypothetical protein
MIIHLNKSISQKEAWEIIKPVCRELYDLVNAGTYNLHQEFITRVMEHTKLI